MKIIILLTIATITSSCGVLMKDFQQMDDSDPRKYESSDPFFDSFVQSFVEKHKDILGKDINVSDIPINFHELPNGTLGVCYSWSDGRREILINKQAWEYYYYTELDHQLLINHELGHCALNRGHNDKKVFSKRLSSNSSGFYLQKLSVMHSGYSVSDKWNYSSSSDMELAYDTELFSRNSIPVIEEACRNINRQNCFAK
jgi:hypothetical protein